MDDVILLAVLYQLSLIINELLIIKNVTFTSEKFTIDEIYNKPTLDKFTDKIKPLDKVFSLIKTLEETTKKIQH
jgi:hypothetical protein